MHSNCFDLQAYIKAGHPDTPINELKKLALHSCSKIKVRVAENSNSSRDILLLLSQDQDPEVRIAVSENNATGIDTMEKLAHDEHVDVRYALAENPNTTNEILRCLTKDENPYVSQRAVTTLGYADWNTVSQGMGIVWSISRILEQGASQLKALS